MLPGLCFQSRIVVLRYHFQKTSCHGHPVIQCTWVISKVFHWYDNTATETHGPHASIWNSYRVAGHPAACNEPSKETLRRESISQEITWDLQHHNTCPRHSKANLHKLDLYDLICLSCVVIWCNSATKGIHPWAWKVRSCNQSRWCSSPGFFSGFARFGAWRRARESYIAGAEPKTPAIDNFSNKRGNTGNKIQAKMPSTTAP